MNLTTIEWRDNAIRIIDQTRLPQKLVYLKIKHIKQLSQAIKLLQVRGAPALGAASSLGVYLGIKDSRAKNFAQFKNELEKVITYLGSSRPTARNLFWGLEQARQVVLANQDKPINRIKELILQKAREIIKIDQQSCRAIGRYGAELIKEGDTILTVCNAGILATIDYGTALGVIYSACGQGKKIKVFACETRPLLQGARLTAWELQQSGIDTTLICDNTAGFLMAEGKIDPSTSLRVNTERSRSIDCVIAGSDRIAANGDAANKIGTLGLAILSKYHKIPFYIAAPASTFDLSIASGKEIVIEQRGGEEIVSLFSRQPTAPQGIKIYNPAFDVTTNALISAIITDQGVIQPPYRENIKRFIQ